ncbi:MAG: YslB family protein [Lactobacillaceae bacterium]|jgi:hypothetical protein|nr:YslB family protein [Lactobacillaceae bacterium]
MSQQTHNVFALTVLRDRVLPDLFKDDLAEISYWAGKSLAREIELSGIAAIITFFTDAGFGDLTIEVQKNTSQKWQLAGPIVKTRLAENPNANFALEAGFLAQQTEQQLGFGAETQTEIGKNGVTFTVVTAAAGTLHE